jgi:hypothetical protein
MRLIGTCFALATLAAAVPALARPPSLEGRWILNLKESELLPGEDKPAELVMAITKDDGTAFRWTVSVKMPDGASGSTSFDGAIDGKPHPVKGRPGSTSAFSWAQDGSLKQVSQSPGGLAIETCSFSADAKKMTCGARQTDKRGRAITYVEVFDRS